VVPKAPVLRQVKAQEVAVLTLTRALRSGRVHHAYLFEGPAGVGKELLAFGLAQALVCERRQGGEADACGECSACRRAILREGERTPAHPDVMLVERGLYDPAQIGRRTPETQDISIDQVRSVVLARAAYPPHEGRARVILVRRAEELSVSAANALLKTLEEPTKGTHFVLLSSQPDVLLPTIRSRALRVRFGPLPDALVTELLVGRGVAPERASTIARLAGGSMEAALALADPEESTKREALVGKAMHALRAPSLDAVLDAAEEAKKLAKGELSVALRAFATALAASARGASGPAAGASLAAARYPFALAALEQLEGNASAQLVVESMLLKMRAAV
jgi:DNA polymerase III subunit delta'